MAAVSVPDWYDWAPMVLLRERVLWSAKGFGAAAACCGDCPEAASTTVGDWP